MDELFQQDELDQEALRKEREREALEKAKTQIKREIQAEEPQFDWKKRLFIIDGYSIIYRSYFAHISKPILDKEDNNVSAYYGFFQTLFSLISNYKMDYIAVTMDRKELTFRHEMYKEYKANRDKAPDDLHRDVPEIIKTLEKMHISVMSKPGFEADDVIASLVKRALSEGIEAVMVTGDKDLCQLVRDHVYVLRPPKKGDSKYHILKKDDVKKEYGVNPEQIVDYLSLVGDSSDNVPGVKGIGEKGASKLLEQYLTLEGIYRHLDSLAPGLKKKLEDGKESSQLSKNLIELSFDALDEGFCFAELESSRIEKNAAGKDFEDRGFRMLSKRAYGLSGREEDDEDDISQAESPSVLTERERESFLGNGEYSKIDSYESLKKKFYDIAEFGSGIIALDILTDGYEDGSDVIGFSFSSEPKSAYFVRFDEASGISKNDIKELFENYLESGKIKGVFHGAKYDLKAIWSLGSNYSAVSFDTMIASWMIDSNQNAYSIEVDGLKYLSVNMLSIKDVLSNKKSLSEVSEDILLSYSAERADITFRLYRILEKRLYEKELYQTYSSIELPLIAILAKMEREGIYLSEERMDTLGVKISQEIDELKKSIFALVGHEFNINSPSQLGSVLFEERKLPVGKKTQKGYSTDIATLEALKSTGDPIISLILDYRTLSKLKSTYIDVLPTLRDERGRVHTTFLQTGTATGRLSSRNPNLQNIPIRTDVGRLIRDAFVPKEGTVFLSADYSQIELVVLAYMSSDKGLTEAFSIGEDVHRYTASRIFNKDVKDVTQKERRIAKTINFGIMYGMSAFRLSNELSITRAEASDFIKRYFERYSGVREFVEKTVREAEKNQFVRTEYGHVREIIGINSRNKTEKAAGERVAVNTVIQGTAAEIMKMSMIRIFHEMEKRRLKSRLLLQVHDELIFEVESDERDEMESLVRESMEHIVQLTVPLRASLQFGSSWGEMH